MEESFDIQSYMTRGVEHIVESSLKATLKDPTESAFMIKFATASKRASSRRAKEMQNGTNVPPFLIASITSKCNLHCAGCYSRCNAATVDKIPEEQLTSDEWLKIFKEATTLGMSYILLAGGEPLLRRDIIEAAGKIQDIIFPIFTNGTFMDRDYIDLFDKKRNLIPVMSLEGNKSVTDGRRGAGVYDTVISNMNILNARHLIFGVSVTVTTANIQEVSAPAFIESLAQTGCKLVIFVEYVPVTVESFKLAPTDAEREKLKVAIKNLRAEYENMVFVSFPGDEKASGGCIAAGRGFFHINSHGDAEPCPFSPYSDSNVKDTSLKEALNSPLFRTLKEGDYLKENHEGGCILYKKRGQVKKIVENGRTPKNFKGPPKNFSF